MRVEIHKVGEDEARARGLNRLLDLVDPVVVGLGVDGGGHAASGEQILILPIAWTVCPAAVNPSSNVGPVGVSA